MFALKNPKPSYSPWLMLGITAIFVAFQFFQQGTIGVFSEQLRESLDLDATSISFLSSCFFYPFILLQIPAGILIDRFGTRKVVTLAACFMTVGCLIFTLQENLVTAVFARNLMGIGGAFSFISMIHVIKDWFELKYFPMVLAMAEVTLMVAVASLNIGISKFSVAFGWRSSMMLCTVLVFFITLGLWIFLQDKKKNREKDFEEWIENKGEFKKQILLLLKNKKVWLAGVFAGTSYAVVTVFVALWGVPFFKVAYHMDAAQASMVLSFVYVGIAIASPILGYLATRGCMLNLMCVGGVLSFVGVSFLVWYTSFSPSHLIFLMICIGMFTCIYQIPFAYVSSHVSHNVQGTATGLTNMLTMIVSPILQPTVGFLLNFSQGASDGHNFEHYSLGSYQGALVVIPLCSMIACYVAFKLRSQKA